MFARSVVCIRRACRPSAALTSRFQISSSRSASVGCLAISNQRHFNDYRNWVGLSFDLGVGKRTMATANTIKLEPGQKAVFRREGITGEMVVKASELLQENHERHHVFFNRSGFHVRIFYCLNQHWPAFQLHIIERYTDIIEYRTISFTISLHSSRSLPPLPNSRRATMRMHPTSDHLFLFTMRT
jgi:hypothetical protein